MGLLAATGTATPAQAGSFSEATEVSASSVLSTLPVKGRARRLDTRAISLDLHGPMLIAMAVTLETIC